jgi:hypothetical protein
MTLQSSPLKTRRRRELRLVVVRERLHLGYKRCDANSRPRCWNRAVSKCSALSRHVPLLPAAQAESFPQTTLPFVLREFTHCRQGVGHVLQLFASRDCRPVVRSRGMACAALRVAGRSHI